MFREMRRKRQQLTPDECSAILRGASSGVLAVLGDGGYPYAVPLSFVYDGDRIYFHCAREGHKLDAVRRESRASFCVIDRDEVVPERYTTRYRSVIAFGRVRVIEDDGEKRAAIEKLALKYSPDEPEQAREAEIESGWAARCMREKSTVHLGGRQGRELLPGGC